MKTRKKIVVTTDVRIEIAKIFEIDITAVSVALNYRTNSFRAKMIRQMALEKGGRILDGTRDENVAGKITYVKQGEHLQ